ncbi:hypothetical protein [Staphylococcus aureus]|uniref:hypothetical protein n=1 Tax=Staphylococcus aureus TaxID=1280 RepID=UPI001C52A49B
MELPIQPHWEIWLILPIFMTLTLCADWRYRLSYLRRYSTAAKSARTESIKIEDASVTVLTADASSPESPARVA